MRGEASRKERRHRRRGRTDCEAEADGWVCAGNMTRTVRVRANARACETGCDRCESGLGPRTARYAIAFKALKLFFVQWLQRLGQTHRVMHRSHCNFSWRPACARPGAPFPPSVGQGSMSAHQLVFLSPVRHFQPHWNRKGEGALGDCRDSAPRLPLDPFH